MDPTRPPQHAMRALARLDLGGENLALRVDRQVMHPMELTCLPPVAAERAALAARIAVNPPPASAFVKQAARAEGQVDLKSGLDLELDLFALLAPMQDVKEAAAAFSEKRAPVFTGQ